MTFRSTALFAGLLLPPCALAQSPASLPPPAAQAAPQSASPLGPTGAASLNQPGPDAPLLLPAPDQPLTLADVIAMATTNSPRLRGAAAGLTRSTAAIRTARSYVNPSVEVFGGRQYSRPIPTPGASLPEKITGSSAQ